MSKRQLEHLCGRCGIALLPNQDICDDCHHELFMEEERERYNRENYDFDYGDVIS